MGCITRTGWTGQEISAHGRSELFFYLRSRSCGTSWIQIPTNANQLAKFNKKNVKAKRIILDSFKDHVISHVTGKKYAFEMWASLTKSY